MGELETLKQDQ